MRIVCPSCSAAYEVSESLLRPGRIVRCVRCGHEWVGLTVEAPLVDEPEVEVLPEVPVEREWEAPRLSAMDRLAQAGPPRPARGVALRTAWAVSIVIVLALLWCGYAWRGEIMAHWPPSIRLYSLLGLDAQRH